MPTKLDKPVIREVSIKDLAGNEGALSVTINSSGVTIRGKGTQRELSLTYADIAANAAVPQGMPNKFIANKLGWLIDRSKPKAPSDLPTDVSQGTP